MFRIDEHLDTLYDNAVPWHSINPHDRSHPAGIMVMSRIHESSVYNSTRGVSFISIRIHFYISLFLSYTYEKKNAHHTQVYRYW